MAPRNDIPPTSTTNVILGVTLSFGIIALILGLYFIYKAYIRLLDHQRSKVPQPRKRDQNQTSVDTPMNRTQPQDERQHPVRRKSAAAPNQLVNLRSLGACINQQGFGAMDSIRNKKVGLLEIATSTHFGALTQRNYPA
ncbi:MAG: hypothetical protein Q9169_000042 [Polycauliona sp. 2 TL-2023]